jgi:UDP-N-acetylmuramoylalanine--D-glutamate ligase
VWLDENEGAVFLSRDGTRCPLFETRDLSLAGRFNALNAAAAAAAAVHKGIEPRLIAEAIREFRAVEHRLEPVLERDGVVYLNDSIATTPESTVAALEALGPNAVFICGGSDKGCSFGALGRALALRARGVVLLGKTADAIAAAIPARPRAVEVRRAATLEDAVTLASGMARPGDRVILSPACPSFDMFLNFAERGRRYKEIVQGLGQSGGPSRS